MGFNQQYDPRDHNGPINNEPRYSISTNKQTRQTGELKPCACILGKNTSIFYD